MAGSILGNVVKRVEDPRFITGTGQYIDDVPVDALHLVLVRSDVAHGVITSIDTEFAAGMPGVVGVYTAADLDIGPVAGGAGAPSELARPTLAIDRVRFVGDVVAVVVAETQRQATDAADMVWADIEPLPAVATVADAVAEGAPRIHDAAESNVIRTFDAKVGADDPMEGADVVIEFTMRHQRLAAVPLEGSAALAMPEEGSDRIEVIVGTQSIMGAHGGIAASSGIDKERLHTRSVDMGGAFGPKFQVYVGQVLAAALADTLQRPVKWVETRAENMVDFCHGRDHTHHIQLGATSDGKLVGIRATVDSNVGAYPTFGWYLPHFTRIMMSGTYVIPNITYTAQSVMTNTTPIHAYRGAGRPEATAAIERAMDLMADALDMDPAELRRKNFIQPDQFPYDTQLGTTYDIGDYEASLDRALELAGYDTLRTDQAERRSRGDRTVLGIGVASYVEITAIGTSEWAEVKIEDDGTFSIGVGTAASGQGHETAFAQIVSHVFGVPVDQVRVHQNDTDKIKRAYGTGGSRSLQVGGSVILNTSEALLETAKEVVARLKEADVDDVVLHDNGLGIAGVPDSAMTWAELAVAVQDASAADLPEGFDGLRHEDDFEQGTPSFPFGAHVCVVEVDTVTGDTKILRHIAVDDCGQILNRLLVDGQVQGGVAQGAGQALIEQMTYDADANPTSGNLVSYLIPTAAMLPSIEIDHTETPSPLNPLGAKGIGESGTIGSTAAIHAAVIDAVKHLGVTHIDMPMTPSRVWEAIRAANGD